MKRLIYASLILLAAGSAALAKAQSVVPSVAAPIVMVPPSAAAATAPDATEQAVRILVERELGTRNRLEIRVGQLDTRVQLAPCARAEPFVPPGVKLWGRTQIGIRCTAGASWAIRLPVTIQVFAQVVVANTALTAGTPLSASDFRLEETDLTRENTPLVTELATLNGKQLTRSLTAGQPVRVDALRTPPTVNAGDPVQIILTGRGFTLSSEGIALTPGSEGQSLRVRTESGRVVAGTLRDRTIELRI